MEGSMVRKTRGWAQPVVLLIVVAAVLITTVILLPVKQYLVSVLEWAQGLGVWGPIVVGASYLVACVLFLPGFFSGLSTCAISTSSV